MGKSPFLDMLKSALGVDENRTELRREKIRPEWQTLYNDVKAERDAKLELEKQVEKIDERLQSKKRLMWATIEKDLETYNDMRWNDETGEVIIWEDKKNDPCICGECDTHADTAVAPEGKKK